MTWPALFIDDGGVMNANTRRGRQWQRLVGQYFAPRLGGASRAWAAANADVANRLFAEYETHFDADPGASFLTYWTTYQEAWLSGMCTAVGVALPADRATWSRLCRDCECFVTRRVRAAYPGVVQEIRRLHAAGYVLRTASGERSWELEGYLIGMGVHGCFVDGSHLSFQTVFSAIGAEGVAAGDGTGNGRGAVIVGANGSKVAAAHRWSNGCLRGPCAGCAA
ncbi:MAG: hypothetical protein LC797_25545 [Chloroflexi bacterium]|nr:hypothetical protein [Chloroflexota bacterium]